MAPQPPDLSAIPEAFAVNGFPLIEFDRKSLDRYTLVSFALEWNDDLTLVHVVNRDYFRLNGYAVFRNSDIRRWRPVPKEDFLARAAVLNKVRPSRPDSVTIGSMRNALSTAGAAFPLITFHRERIKRDVCFVGKFKRVNQRTVTIEEITPQAEWGEDERYSLRDITLLEFGGAYESLLYAMAAKR